MSMPKIPDITPKINITFEDSINLLLTSVAMEEISMSKLMDAEKDKVLFVINECKTNEASVGDVLNVNESVNSIIKNLINMQMLLQIKLENIKSLIPTTSTSTTTTTTTSTTSTCSTTTKRPKCECCLMGKSSGVVSNQSDEFHCKDVTLSAFVSSCNCGDNIIRYHVGDDHNSLYMKAKHNNIKIECPYAMQPDVIKIRGKGRLTRVPECKKTYMDVDFELLVWYNKVGINIFKMIIFEHEVVVHNSGFVKICCCNSGLRLQHLDKCYETLNYDN